MMPLVFFNNRVNAAHRSRQQGISLVTVLVMMMLSLLLALGGSRVSLLNERLSGNSTDYQRAYEAAEALMADARLDVACMTGACANRTTVTQFTCDTQQFLDLQTTLSALNPPCADGICMDLGTESDGNPGTSFWNNPGRWTTFTTGNRGARFGQYTGTAITAAQVVNPLLVDRSWYWVEILRYGAGGGGGRSMAGEQTHVGQNPLVPISSCSFVFRVTAAAQGRRLGTTAVLQSFYFFRPS
jgi:Tfp pilus assembly protein PilX